MPSLTTQSVLLEDDCVRILDRRSFPFKTEFVVCATHEDVADAIEQMVTQSSGPYFAAGAGMVLAARAAGRLAVAERAASMEAAGARLIRTRPTNNNVRQAVGSLLAHARENMDHADFAQSVEAAMRKNWSERNALSRKLGEHAASLIEDGDTLLTHCWGESGLVEAIRATLAAGKKFKLICTETRPYLQGSRLTAHSAAEMGVDVTVITDNMGAHAMDSGKVSKLVTAADRVTMSGHVINKVGTYQLAIAAQNFGIPFLALVQAPDRNAASPSDVAMEERDGDESLHCMGMRTATPLARGWYPAFDVTPPRFVAAIATNRGVFHPMLLRSHFA